MVHALIRPLAHRDKIKVQELIGWHRWFMVQDMNVAQNGSQNKTSSGHWKYVLVLALVLGWLGSRDRGEEDESVDVASLPTSTQAAESEGLADIPAEDSSRLMLGEWQSYPELAAEQEWTKEPLDGPRWAQVSAELACAGRSSRGDPVAHLGRVRSIIAHHRTSLTEISSFSTRLNQGGPAQAHRWARPISEAVKGCH
jgi:hypothetical protein